MITSIPLRQKFPYDRVMDLALPKLLAPDAPQMPPLAKEGEAGTSRGVNIAPGSHDDGWVVPDPVTLSDGTRVQLYKDGEALHAAYEAIKHAKHRVCLEVYIFADDPTGNAFADLLCTKAQQGVKVYVIYDSFGSINTDRKMFRKMRHAGVRLEEFHPIRPWDVRFSWRPFNRDHRKLLLVDYDIAGMGGLNIGHEYAGSWAVPSRSTDKCEAWRDTAIGMILPSARYFLRAVAHTWRYIQHSGRILTPEYQRGMLPARVAQHPALSSPWWSRSRGRASARARRWRQCVRCSSARSEHPVLGAHDRQPASPAEASVFR